jgi:hypothetical protein
MKYLFAINIGCDVYKKYPKLQLFADEKLIDEFQIDEQFHDNLQWIDNTRFQKYCVQKSGGKFKTQLAVRNNQFRLYSIDDLDLEKKITIKIYNSDSNYTNGFMTKSTLVYFGPIIFMPEYFLQDDAKKYLELWQEYVTESTNPSRPDGTYRSWPWVNFGMVDGALRPFANSLTDPQTYDERYMQNYYSFGGDCEIDLHIDKKTFEFKTIDHDDIDDVSYFHNDYWALDVGKSSILRPGTNTSKTSKIIMSPKIFGLLERFIKNKYLQ